jgi:hypothetical protein
LQRLICRSSLLTRWHILDFNVFFFRFYQHIKVLGGKIERSMIGKQKIKSESLILPLPLKFSDPEKKKKRKRWWSQWNIGTLIHQGVTAALGIISKGAVQVLHTGTQRGADGSSSSLHSTCTMYDGYASLISVHIAFPVYISLNSMFCVKWCNFQVWFLSISINRSFIYQVAPQNDIIKHTMMFNNFEPPSWIKYARGHLVEPLKAKYGQKVHFAKFCNIFFVLIIIIN